MGGRTLGLFLCGDVMLGRGVDQILPHPGDPTLRETYVRDARTYAGLAQAASGSFSMPVPFTWPWGDALPLLDEVRPDIRVVNLETSITRGDDFADGKELHYRMNPANLDCLSAVRPDVCVLANNHVLDFGRGGLTETLRILDTAGLAYAGAGRDAEHAWRPVITPVAGGRVLTFAAGMASSGVPPEWAATADRPGVAYIGTPTAAAAASISERVQRVRQPGDIVVMSIHAGSNWGYRVPDGLVAFARALIDGGVDVVHGHSSHHVRPIEVYRGRLILYGCGDLINDYEGIGGHEDFRDDLRVLYLPTVVRDTGELVGLRMAVMLARRMRLWRADEDDCRWLLSVMERTVRGDVALGVEPGATLTVTPKNVREIRLH